MAEHLATVSWVRPAGAPFTDNKYSRAHRWTFDGGAEVLASASPHVVPVPMSDQAGVDPEEAFVAAIASCHMLWFLWVAAKRQFVVELYEDRAAGRMERNAEGRYAITRVTLRPKVEWAGNAPDAATLDLMHHESHEKCFIANSVKTAITVEAR